MPKNPHPKSLSSAIALFCAGFVLGAAFMASPALGLVCAMIAAAYLAYIIRSVRS